MQKKLVSALVAALLVGTPAGAFFSGERELAISKESIATFPTVTVTTLLGLEPDARYIGTIPEWHIFAEKLTSSEGGMPFDSVYGYRIRAREVALTGGQSIDFSRSKSYYAFVQNCATFTVTQQPSGVAIIVIEQPGQCLYPTAAD